MGQDWRPNTAISNVLLHKLLNYCELKYKAAETFDIMTDWIVAGTYFTVLAMFVRCEGQKVC
jgi:hypothetical protein